MRGACSNGRYAMTDFENVIPTLNEALKAKGYETLTPVQVEVSQPEFLDQDLLVSAQTGSGKTVAFGLAIAPTILEENGRFERAATPLALVIAPTRELALQVKREFDWLFAPTGVVVASTVGGMDSRTERRALERGAHIVVATPGRLRDHIMRGAIDLSALRAVVLDEADEMLDMGFSEDLEYILDATPSERRTLMFSATVPRGIAKLAQKYQRKDTKRVETIGEGPQHADITYRAMTVAPSDTENAIINTLRYYEAQNAIVFANTRAMVARLTARFSNRGFSVVSLSGELSQNERTHALQAMRDGRARVCVATDVAARGIDLPNLELVIHADLPSNGETLLHRSGRTGRAGRKGISALIVPGRQKSKAERLLRFAKLTAEWSNAPSADDVNARDEERMLNDPSWSEALSEDEQSFAGKLLSQYKPEQIAAAFLRLHRSKHSAPEQLGEVTDTRGKREPREPRAPRDFGPSSWFSLSLGRKHKAEPRWLLPMLCRNGNISKDDIGAIRVQYQETFVEVQTSAVERMKKELGEGLDLEQGAKLTELPGKPDFDASPNGPPADGPARPHRKGLREDRPRGDKPRYDKPRHDGPRGDKPSYDKPRSDKPKFNKPKGKAPYKADKPGKNDPRPSKHTAKSGTPNKSKPARAPSAVDTGAVAHKTATPKPKSRKGAMDPSKPMGDRKARAKAAAGKPKGGESKPYKVKTRAGKGPEARPMRKSPRKP
ncbi:ATP-dependent RNA helicase [Rhodobacteraceae bacterium HTCC2083]|nr:ATP-dependent RNA helicase [Rhodobacteraceae bacterium HTCC2083]